MIIKTFLNSFKKEYTKYLVCLLLLPATTNRAIAQTCKTPFHIVILGSSTAYGDGASSPDKAWAGLYTAYLKKIDSGYIVDNLAAPGTTTYAAQPNTYVPPAGRPAPYKGHNISKAIALKADAIIINYPSNDAVNDYTLQEQKDNFKRITDLAHQHHILVWVATPQPRDYLTAQQVSSQKKLLSWIEAYYKGKSINFQAGLASAKDSILFKYSYGDGIHLNDAGHLVLYHRVVNEHIPDSLCSRKNNFEADKTVPIAFTSNKK
jgi:lysophospholipase L1-like esterase